MSKPAKLVKMSILLTVLLFLAAVDDFLSLHDISKDYVSRSALDYVGITTTGPLPDWTRTSLEWTSVRVSYWLRVGLLCLNFGLLFRLWAVVRTRG